MKKTTLILLGAFMVGAVLLASCKKKEENNNNNNSNGSDVIGLMDNVGFVSTNSDYNTLYGGNAVNDFLITLDEKAAGDDIEHLELVVRNGETADTLDMTAIGKSPKEITEDKYVRHFQVEIPEIANATGVEAQIFAFNESDKQLAKISFTVNTKSTKAAGYQMLQFPTSGFYTVENTFWPYTDNTTPFLGELDEEAAAGDKRHIAVRVYGAGYGFDLIPHIILFTETKVLPIHKESTYYDVRGADDSSNLVFLIDDDANPETQDVGLTIAEDHFFDDDDNAGTPDVALYKLWSDMEPIYQFKITRKQ